jgi:hypothetical protein
MWDPFRLCFFSDCEKMSMNKLFYGASWNSVEVFKKLSGVRMIFMKTGSMVVTSYLGAQTK